MKTIYLAGPMTGIPEYNYPAFHKAADQLSEYGYKVINPARERNPDFTYADYLRRGLVDLLDADGVALLPGWENSQGARLEAHVGHAVGMRVSPLSVYLYDAQAGQAW